MRKIFVIVHYYDGSALLYRVELKEEIIEELKKQYWIQEDDFERIVGNAIELIGEHIDDVITVNYD